MQGRGGQDTICGLDPAHRAISSSPQGFPQVQKFGGEVVAAALIAAVLGAVAINDTAVCPAAKIPDQWGILRAR